MRAVRPSGRAKLLHLLVLPFTLIFGIHAASTGLTSVSLSGEGGLEEISTFIPCALKDSGYPSIPILNAIENSDEDGAYEISWSEASQATGYTLEETDSASFASPLVIYSGPDTTHAVAGQAAGIYYYRVKAENVIGQSGWSEVKSATVTPTSGLICETHNFGTVGVGLPILTSGSTYHFAAENDMQVETVEVKSVLKAFLPLNVYVAVGVNGEQWANKTHYVYSYVYTPYSINSDVAKELHAGDDIYYYVAKGVGDGEAWIGWGNYVELCEH